MALKKKKEKEELDDKKKAQAKGKKRAATIKHKPLVGLDIGSHSIKVVYLNRTAEGFALVALGTCLVPPGAVEDGVLQDPDKVGAVIAKLFKNLKINNRKVGISISGYSVIVKKINIDAMEEAELRKTIRSDAEQYIPFDISDVYLDFKDLKTSTEDFERTDVMLVAAKREVVDGYLDMLQKLRLQPVLVDIDGFALENSFETVCSNAGNVVLVDIGASKMNINIVVESSSVLARDIAVGSHQLTEQIAGILDVDIDEAEKIKLGIVHPEENVDEITNAFTSICTQWVLEIKRAIDLYRSNNPDKPLDKLILCGGGSGIQGFDVFVRQETGLEVQVFNPFDYMQYSTKKIDPEYIRMVGPKMAIASGLAIRPASM